ncbi:MAG: helix-turn-helix transcriptional regulator [Candidatus Dormibacteria bacterium]
MATAARANGIKALDVLAEPTRRELYRLVARYPDGLSRDDAAHQTHIGRALAAYHLDRLHAAGLLDVEYRRPPGRGGPGAGRPAKFYRRSERAVQLSLPPRNDVLLSEIFATSMDPRGTATPPRTVVDAAHRRGCDLGARARERAGARPSRRRLQQAALDALDDEGFEPEIERGAITLRNCPFHAVAQSHRRLVCGVNHVLMQGFAGSLGEDVCAELQPDASRCCVVLRV